MSEENRRSDELFTDLTKILVEEALNKFWEDKMKETVIRFRVESLEWENKKYFVARIKTISI